MGACIVGVATVAVLVAISVGANQRLGNLTEIPMQWGLDGKPIWYAPRRLALAFTPAIGAIVLVAVALKTVVAHGKPGTILVVAAAIVLAHLLHLAIMVRTLRS